MFQNKYINRRDTIGGIYNYSYMGFFASICAGCYLSARVGVDDSGARAIIGMFISIPVLIAAFFVVQSQIIRRQVTRRQKQFELLSAAKGWKLDPMADSRLLDGTALYDMAKAGRRYQNHIVGPDWEYMDFTYATYTDNKNRETEASNIYYGVMSTKLPRQLPNVFFDSKNHKGSQFEKLFVKNQHHVLEGGFDRYFDTYFAPGYTIDSLSFVTPDVMEALIQASQYDIEIKDDRLLIYGPLFAPGEQVDEMAAKITAIKSKLLNNILTYRDERLPYEQGRLKVAPGGISLRKRQYNFWIVSASTLFYLVIYILSQFIQNQ